MNEILIKELEKLVEQIKYEVIKSKTPKDKLVNNIRLKNTINLIKTIKKYPTKIKSGEEIQHLKGVGKNSVKRINEILEKGKLQEIKIDRTDKKIMEAIKNLTRIYGIGESIAIRLIKEYNIHNIKELKKGYLQKKVPLNDHILLGLKYEKVYEKKIPRKEIDDINNYLKKIISSVDKNLLYMICGSYRREKPESNDIDILLVNKNIITKEQLDKSVNYLKIVINKLKDEKFIIDDIDKNFQVKYMGFCKYENKPIRHIDIMYIPYESFWTAILHFTGSGDFNERLRHHAKLLGYKLNQYGLYKKEYEKDNNKKKVKKLNRIMVNSEKEIFDILGMEYIEPKFRD
ncbi:DNA polymerase family X protein [Hokovirus HKV1]|uniref:DNA-directed DNA polymerase n=1 Tax=Hokovirus HKV1 TaxID=1977638 RepID=A0A1V0SGE0_9VIRU|nr:DNA polymerase family X protein [Hokovirus HKV1]